MANCNPEKPEAIRKFVLKNGPVTYRDIMKAFDVGNEVRAYVKAMRPDGVLDLGLPDDSNDRTFLCRLFGKGCRGKLIMAPGDPDNVYRLYTMMLGALEGEGLYAWHVPLVHRQLDALVSGGLPAYAADAVRAYCAAAATEQPLAVAGGT